MATNTSALKTFAQQTRVKLISLITTKMKYVLESDTAELRGYEREIEELKKQIRKKTEKVVIEEIAYTWFNRVMALRFMDANGYNAPMIVTPAEGQTRPEILQEAMGGSIDEELMLAPDERFLPEAKLYRKLLVAVCNKKMSHPMPFLFEQISDYTELLLPDDLLSEQSFVSDIRKGMSDEDCQNVEVMGWLYQFYITDRKADAEAKKSKKGGLKSDEQAAATQLFTPHWIVRYMVENSLGRIWMTLHPESHLIDDMPYYIATPEGQTDTIPEDIHSAKDIRFLDPCMGSGHILVYAFDLLTKMYEEEGEQTKDIPTLILNNNLFGIDIDRRCYQLACFALTMKARAYYRRYLRQTVTPHVIALQVIDRETIASTGNWPDKSLMWQFENIDTIGSLLKVTPEEYAAIHVDNGLFGERQRLMKTQAEYLSRKYHCVVTNPPYLGKGIGDILKAYIKTEFPNSKTDLYSVFIENLSKLPCPNGFTAMVTMESWMFLSSFEKLREYLLKNKTIINLSHFDWHIMRIAFGTVAFVIQNTKPANHKGVYSYLSRNDVDLQNEIPYAFPKKDNGRYTIKAQSDYLNIPGYVIGYWASINALNAYSSGKLVKNFSFPKTGMTTGENNRFLRMWYEVEDTKSSLIQSEEVNTNLKWFPYLKGGGTRRWYGFFDFLINWENNGSEVKNNTKPNGVKVASVRSEELYFKPLISWSAVSSGKFTCRFVFGGSLFDSGGSSLLAQNANSYFLLGLLNTPVAQYFMGITNPTINYQPGDVACVPVIDYGLCIDALVEDNIIISRQDWDAHETSWDFKTNELYRLALGLTYDQVQSLPLLEGSLNLSLEEVLNRHTQYWQEKFMQLHHNEEELNRQFIELYGLQDELTPNVPLDEITILQKGEISIKDNQIVWHTDVIIKQFISWLIGCLMGRYSADKPGLIIASQGQKVSDLNLPMQTLMIDDDGIIPIIQEEDFFTDDMAQRIETAVKTLFGEEHFYENMKFINKCLGQELRDYLYKDFYSDHIDGKMYQKRPIYWLFSSQMGDKKKKGYFKALIYMHRMEADTLSKLHADYVHPYLQKIEQQLVEAEDNATRDDLSQTQHNKALKIADELRDKVREVKAFETALVEMASARITIDLDDGVKANYPKYYPLVEPIKGLDSKEED